MIASETQDILNRFNVRVTGTGARTMVFAHGFGCDQSMWRFVAPAFENDFRVVLFDLVGAGRADTSSYSPAKYNSLGAYASDVLQIASALKVKDAVFVGHSVSAMIGVLAAKQRPGVFTSLVLVGPSPRYINDGGYKGGFEKSDIDDLLESLASNYLGWSSVMAPVIMGNNDRPELGEELTKSFCSMNPEIAQNFARITFLSDNREDLKNLEAKVLILQCSNDRIAPTSVGEYVHAQIAGSQLVQMQATGHCPNLSAPEETTAAIRAFVT